MQRQIGLCTWTFGPISFGEQLRHAVELGVDGIEISGNLTQDPTSIGAEIKRCGLRVLSITPQDVDLASVHDNVRRDAVAYYLQLLPWAQKVGAERIGIHGEVGRLRGCGDLEKDWSALVCSVREITQAAQAYQSPLVFEVLNRYENHQINTCAQAKRLIEAVGSVNLQILLDAYHMNIEEADPVAALKLAAGELGLYHLADSNRQAAGQGHSQLAAQMAALDEMNYTGPIVMEMTAAGPDPFTPVKSGEYLEVLTGYYRSTIEWLNSTNRK